MCKEMPVILVNRVVDPKRIIGKNGRGGGEAQGVADPTKKIGRNFGRFSDSLCRFFHHVSGRTEPGVQ
jgi:hypothetical protein